MTARQSYYEANARQRLAGVLDPASLREFTPPAARLTSPHLPRLGLPVAFDDGIVVGRGRLDGRAVLAATQEGGFMGGAVGEVHGAKLTGLLERALDERPAAVLLLLESGGVRLHEANAGLIGVSEAMRALLAARAGGVPVIGLVGATFGCFGGIGLLAACCDRILISEEGRLGMSGPEVIETAHGADEFDSRDRALVWRTVGGKHRYLLGDAQQLVEDDIGAFRQAAIAALAAPDLPRFGLDDLVARQAALGERLARFGDCADATDIWRAAGDPDPAGLPLLERDAFLARTEPIRLPRTRSVR